MRKDQKEPKALRHQEGKEKCKIYQRSLSGKMRQPQVDILAIVGIPATSWPVHHPTPIIQTHHQHQTHYERTAFRESRSVHEPQQLSKAIDVEVEFSCEEKR
jgi:hypothetical protein